MSRVNCNFVSFHEVVASVAAFNANQACYTQEATKEHIEKFLKHAVTPEWFKAICQDACDVGSLKEHADQLGSTLLYLDGSSKIVYCAQ